MACACSKRSRRSMVRQAHHERLDLPLVLSSSKDALRSRPCGRFKVQGSRVQSPLPIYSTGQNRLNGPHEIRADEFHTRRGPLFGLRSFATANQTSGTSKAGPAEFAGRNGRTQPGNQLALFGLGARQKRLVRLPRREDGLGSGYKLVEVAAEGMDAIPFIVKMVWRMPQ